MQFTFQLQLIKMEKKPLEIKIEVSSVSTNSAQHCSTTTFLTLLGRAKCCLAQTVAQCDIEHFRISMSMCMQALLWKTLVCYTTTISGTHLLDQHYHKLSSMALILLWCLSLFALGVTSLAYVLKCGLHFDLVKQEFLHHVGGNYFFAPWISCLLLLQSYPNLFPMHNDISYYCWVFVVPIVALGVKIYGQWFTKGKRFLSRVANPASQIGIIANLAAAGAMSGVGWEEGGLFFFSLGMAHYLVLFVTLYQRMPGGDEFPTSARPVFFLFIATPSMGSLAWSSIHGGFDNASKMLFFLSLFLFLSLVSRPLLFKKAMKKYNVAWWSSCFSLSLLALTALKYAEEVKSTAAHAMMLLLSIASILLFVVLLIFTALHTNLNLSGNDDLQERATSDNNSIVKPN